MSPSISPLRLPPAIRSTKTPTLSNPHRIVPELVLNDRVYTQRLSDNRKKKLQLPRISEVNKKMHTPLVVDEVGILRPSPRVSEHTGVENFLTLHDQCEPQIETEKVHNFAGKHINAPYFDFANNCFVEVEICWLQQCPSPGATEAIVVGDEGVDCEEVTEKGSYPTLVDQCEVETEAQQQDGNIWVLGNLRSCYTHSIYIFIDRVILLVSECLEVSFVSWFQSSVFRTPCTPSTLLKIIAQLSDAQKEVGTDIGFGGLLLMKASSMNRQLIKWVVENFDDANDSLCLPNGSIVFLSYKDFGKCLGISFYGESILPHICLSDVQTPSWNKLMLKFEGIGSGNCFRLWFFQFVCCTLLTPISRKPGCHDL